MVTDCAYDSAYSAHQFLGFCLCKRLLRHFIDAIRCGEWIQEFVPDALKQDCHLSDWQTYRQGFGSNGKLAQFASVGSRDLSSNVPEPGRSNGLERVIGCEGTHFMYDFVQSVS